MQVNELRYLNESKSTLHLNNEPTTTTQLTSEFQKNNHVSKKTDGSFLTWDFNSLSSGNKKDLLVSNGTIAFQSDGQLVLNDDTSLTYPTNRYFPKRDFAISVLYTDNTQNGQGEFSISFNSNPTFSLTIGYNPVLEFRSISFNTITFTDGSNLLLPPIDNYTRNTTGENEVTLVVDHAINQEIRLFINDSLIARNTFDATKDILLSGLMRVYNRIAGVTLNKLQILNTIPEKYLETPETLTYPSTSIFFRLNPKYSSDLISEHTTTIDSSGSATPTHWISTTKNINGNPVFEGTIKTNSFPHNSDHNYTVAFVTSVSNAIGSWAGFFEFSISTNIPRDNGFVIERIGSTNTIASQTNSRHTNAWDYSLYIDTPVVFFASMEGGTKVIFKVFEISTGTQIHEGILNTNKSVQTADGPVIIGMSSGFEQSNSPFGEFIFYNRLLSDSETVQLITYLVSEWKQ